jgi:protein SCO1/2
LNRPPRIHIIVLPAAGFINILLLCFSLSISAWAHEDNITGSLGIREMTGRYVPLDLTFLDETGKEVTSRDIFNKPTILTLVYYSCDHICPQMLEGLGIALEKLALEPGRDYGVVTISFDEGDTPKIAEQVKKNYIGLIHRKSLSEDSWRFLTAKGNNIKSLTDAVGFHFRRDMHGFVHPALLIILSPHGKITRYIYASKYAYGVAYPVTFSPFELKTALTDASQEKVFAGRASSLLYCFPHEPKNQETFFSILSIAGWSMLFLLAAFFIYLATTSKKFRGDKK